MSADLKDPMGQAIIDYSKNKINENIIVISEICEDDIIPSEYLFRSYDEMPEIERLALKRCSGAILDVGAGAGIHAEYLLKQGKNVSCIDISPLSVQYLKSQKIAAREMNFFQLQDEKYDTLLMLMNGLGIAGTLDNLEYTLLKAKSHLTKNGKILCDSSDIKYLYEDDEGGYWVDLNAGYYGNFKFQMKYKNHTSDWFDWLYVDFDNLKKIAEKIGFNVELIFEEESQYLVELTIKE